LRAAARAEALSSADGASPKMKNLMNTNRMAASVNCPSKNPQKNDSEATPEDVVRIGVNGWPSASESDTLRV
jgi:hypothetical protein